MRWIVGLFGAAVIIFAVVIRNDALSAPLLVAGLVLILAGYVGRWLKRIEVDKSGLKLETSDREERDAAAEIADTTSTFEEYEAVIASDDPSPPGPSNVDSKIIGGLNLAAGEIALRAIFQRATSQQPLSGCTLRLYLFDEDERVLSPALGDGSLDAHWEPGKGATGTAFLTGEYVLATGEEAWDDTYGLNPEQQKRYRSLTAVASVPVFNAAGTVIAVVTAQTTEPDSLLSADAGEVALVEVSLLASRVLVELLQWFDDDR